MNSKELWHENVCPRMDSRNNLRTVLYASAVLIRGIGTVIFLMIAAEPMLEKTDRIKVKYGLAG